MASEPRALLLAFGLLAALALPARALAQEPSAADKETARTLMDTGDERMDAKDYAAAVKAYVASDTLMHLPMTGVAVARAQAAAGLLLEARDKAIQVAQLPRWPNETEYYVRARAEAADLANTLASRIPSIQVVLSGGPAGATVTIDSVTLPAATAGEPRKVNPGRHRVEVSAPGFVTASVDVTVSERSVLKVPVALTAAASPPVAPPLKVTPSPPPAGVSPLTVAGFAIGGAGLVVAAITGGLSLSRTSALKAVCATNGDCGSSHDHDLTVANTLANVSNATIAIGAAGVALGVVGVALWRPRARSPAAGAHVEPVLGPGAIGLRGGF